MLLGAGDFGKPCPGDACNFWRARRRDSVGGPFRTAQLAGIEPQRRAPTSLGGCQNYGPFLALVIIRHLVT